VKLIKQLLKHSFFFTVNSIVILSSPIWVIPFFLIASYGEARDFGIGFIIEKPFWS